MFVWKKTKIADNFRIAVSGPAYRISAIALSVLFFLLAFTAMSGASVYAFNLQTYQTLSPKLFLFSYKEYIHPETDTEYGFFTGLEYRLNADDYLSGRFGLFGNIGADAEIGKIHYNGFMALDNNTMTYYYHTDGMINESQHIGVFEKDRGFTVREYVGAGLRYWIRTSGGYDNRLSGTAGYGLSVARSFYGYNVAADFMQSYIPRSELNFVTNRGQKFFMGEGYMKDASLSLKKNNLSVSLYYELIYINGSNYEPINGIMWYEPSSVTREGGVAFSYGF